MTGDVGGRGVDGVCADCDLSKCRAHASSLVRVCRLLGAVVGGLVAAA